MISFKDLVEIHNERPIIMLPTLPYRYDSFEPHIDAETMEEHYTKHHRKYVDTLNSLTDGTPAYGLTLEEILGDVRSYSTEIRNNAGGVWNHNFFWPLLSPNQTKAEGKLELDIVRKWGTIDTFFEKFKEAGLKRFGSGWVWLVKDSSGELSIVTTPNQDNPLMVPNNKYQPIIGCDVWEHAYYLKHKSNRGGWLDVFFEVLNWEQANKNYGE